MKKVTLKKSQKSEVDPNPTMYPTENMDCMYSPEILVLAAKLDEIKRKLAPFDKLEEDLKDFQFRAIENNLISEPHDITRVIELRRQASRNSFSALLSRLESVINSEV